MKRRIAAILVILAPLVWGCTGFDPDAPMAVGKPTSADRAAMAREDAAAIMEGMAAAHSGERAISHR